MFNSKAALFNCVRITLSCKTFHVFLSGVGHAGDMVYLFPNGTNLTSEETEVSKKVVSLYANFVING